MSLRFAFSKMWYLWKVNILLVYAKLELNIKKRRGFAGILFFGYLDGYFIIIYMMKIFNQQRAVVSQAGRWYQEVYWKYTQTVNKDIYKGNIRKPAPHL